MDPGRRVSFEKECSSKAAAVLEQMKEILRRAGQADDIEVMRRGREREEREREREREVWIRQSLSFIKLIELPSRVGDCLPLSSCGILRSGRGASNGQAPYSYHEW